MAEEGRPLLVLLTGVEPVHVETESLALVQTGGVILPHSHHTVQLRGVTDRSLEHHYRQLSLGYKEDLSSVVGLNIKWGTATLFEDPVLELPGQTVRLGLLGLAVGDLLAQPQVGGSYLDILHGSYGVMSFSREYNVIYKVTLNMILTVDNVLLMVLLNITVKLLLAGKCL